MNMHLRFISASVTDVGLKRSQNQDSIFADEARGFFVVADGMGGYEGGEIASQMAVDLIPQYLRRLTDFSTDWRASLGEAIWQANEAIFKKAQENDRKLANMGTTVTALLFHRGLLTIGHVGDSRCYYVLGDRMWPLTQDHSYVEEKIRAGLISREEAQDDPLKNVITRSVGYEENVVPDYFEMCVSPYDLFLICSDGLCGYLTDSQIHEFLKQKLPRDRRETKRSHLKEAAQLLVDRANQAGGEDNVSVILAMLTEKST